MKKSGKRFFSLVLTLILAFALAVPAFAANVTIESEHNKKATYEAYKLMTLTTSLKCGETDTLGHVHDEGCYNYSYKINSKYENILKDVLKITAAGRRSANWLRTCMIRSKRRLLNTTKS